MSIIQNKNNTFHPIKKIIAMSLSGIMTTLVCISTSTYASDIDIYKEARSGKVTLMFALDISNSMTNSGSYDLPSGCNATNTIDDNFTDPSLGISYPRKYKACNQTITTVTPVEKQVTVKTYSYYRYTTSSTNYQWYKCSSTTDGTSENRANCTVSISAPSNSALNGFLSETNGNRNTYYYKNQTKTVIENVTTTTTTQVGKHYRRLDRVRDAMYQVLYGANAITDDRIIGLSVSPYDKGGSSL